MVVLFLIFLKKLYTVFHNGCTYLHSHQQCTWVPFSHAFGSTFIFFENSHSNRCEMMLCVVLICISLSKGILNIFSCNYVNISFCFSQTSYGYTFLVLFAPSCGRFLGLCALLTLQCTGLSDGCAPLAFPRDVQTLKFVISPWPVDAGWLSVP